ncbi:hypothetical protein JCM33374_g4694 [Metschnikowia sp. JCM 33374]|nr:hypothetical protein JCM33374_g4694 [Metschnikowia sp. JCM 33374]
MAPIDFNWDVFPSTELEERHMVTPLGCMVTPFEHPTTPTSLSSPIACSSCGSYINSYVRIDRANRMWWCNMCSKISFVPDDFYLHEKNFPDSDTPLETRPTPQNTVDCVLSRDITSNARTSDDDFTVTYVLDTYQHTEAMVMHEFNSATDALAESVWRLPASTPILSTTFSGIEMFYNP